MNSTQFRVFGQGATNWPGLLWHKRWWSWSCRAEAGHTWESSWHRGRRLRGSLWWPSFPHPPPGWVESPVCWTPEGQKGPTEDDGGRDCVVHLLPQEVFVHLCSTRTITSSVGTTWCDWSRRRCRCPEAEQRPPSREGMGPAKESRPSQHPAGESSFEKGTFQNWLRWKCSKYQLISSGYKKVLLCLV